MKKTLLCIVSGIILICFFIPEKFYCTDGGSYGYRAPAYQLTFYHQIDDTQPGGYYTGTGLKILNIWEIFWD